MGKISRRGTGLIVSQCAFNVKINYNYREGRPLRFVQSIDTEINISEL